MQHSPLSSVLLATSLLSLPLAAQSIEFTELLLDPVGSNPGAQLVEVRNTSNLPQDLTGWQLQTMAYGVTLPPVTIPAYQIALLHIGQPGTSTSTDIYLPTLTEIYPFDTLSLFRSNQTQNPADLVDFVSYSGGMAGITIAIAAGQWPSTNETVLRSLVEGHSVAHFDRMSYGNRNRAAAWYRDGTPTIGAENDAGGIFVGAYGCPGQTPSPLFGSGEADNRPWIGQTWTLDYQTTTGQPSLMWIAVGEQTTQLPLDSIGMPGCFLGVTPYTIVMRSLPTTQGALAFGIPNSPVLIQEEFFLQGLVAWPSLNPANLSATRVIHATVGSR